MVANCLHDISGLVMVRVMMVMMIVARKASDLRGRGCRMILPGCGTLRTIRQVKMIEEDVSTWEGLEGIVSGPCQLVLNRFACLFEVTISGIE